MTHNQVAAQERRTVMTATRPEIENLILGLSREGRFIGAGQGTDLGDGRWKVPLVFREAGTRGQDLAPVSRPAQRPDLARVVFRDPPAVRPRRRRWPYVAGGVVGALVAGAWVVVTVGGMVAVYGTTILGALFVVGVLLAAAHSGGGGHRCILPGCRH